MTNEKDREEAKSFVSDIANCIAYDRGRHDAAIMRAITKIASIRAEAVKAEREKCADRAIKYCSPFFPWGEKGSHSAGLRAAILSDDQENVDPTDTDSYAAYSAGWGDGYKAKGVERDWIEEGYAKWLKEANRG